MEQTRIAEVVLLVHVVSGLLPSKVRQMDPGAHGEVLGVVDEHRYPRLKGIPGPLGDRMAAG